jgi:hypothetical protein
LFYCCSMCEKGKEENYYNYYFVVVFKPMRIFLIKLVLIF